MLKLEQWDRDHGAIEQNGIERLDLWLFFREEDWKKASVHPYVWVKPW